MYNNLRFNSSSSPSPIYFHAIKPGIDDEPKGRLNRSQPGALFASTYPSRSPKVRMSNLLQPLDSATGKRVRIKSPTNSTISSIDSVKRAPSGRIRLVPLKSRDAEKEIERKKTERKVEEKRLKSPVMGLVPVMDQYRGIRPRKNKDTGEFDHKLTSTDVTSNLVRSQDLSAKRYAYYEELEKQANDRKKQEVQRRLRERNEAHKHYEAWTNLWGRPGHGAPRNSTNHKKENLWRLLLDPRIFEKKI